MTPILALGFLTPWLMAAGAAATSIPIVIHLLNKRKFRTVIWAAMDWLLAAQRRNARRLKFQRWLLLAIRCLAILVIAAGVAQLVLQSTALGALFGRQRTAVVIWDDSYSMGYQRPAGPTPFERSRKLLLDWNSHLDPADKIMLIHAARSAAASPAAKPTVDHAAIQSQITAAQLTDASTDLASALDQAASALKDISSSAQTRLLILLTDLTQSSIPNPQTDKAESDRLKAAAAAAKAQASDLKIFDLGQDDQMNLAITNLQSKRPAVVAGVPADFTVTVFNATGRQQRNVKVDLLLDGLPMGTQVVSQIDNSQARSTEITLTIPTVGRHLIEARLPADLLPIDDVRRLMVNVRHEIPVLLVDGSPGDGGRTSYGSTAYLWAAYFSSEVGGASIFAPKTTTELELPATPLAPYGVVILSDTTELKPPVIDSLKKYVQSGGLLIIFPGGHTSTQQMNDTLGDKAAALLPATLLQIHEVKSDNGEGLPFPPEFSHPVLSVFESANREGKQVGFTSVRTNKYLLLGVPTDGSVETILKFKKPDGTTDPAVVLKSVGAGKVVLFATSADTQWNNWGPEPSFLPFIHELTYYAMGRELETGRMTLRVGDRINLPADFAAPGAWSAPRQHQIDVASLIDPDGKSRLSSPPLALAGTYAAPGDPRPVVVVNPDPEEADVQHVSPAQMAAALGLDPATILPAPPALDPPSMIVAAQSKGWTLGSWLILAALGLFLLETILAMAFSRYR